MLGLLGFVGQLLLQVATSERYQQQISCSTCAFHQGDKKEHGHPCLFNTDLVTSARPANHEGARMIQLCVVPWHRLSKTMCPKHQVRRIRRLGSLQEKASPIIISDYDLQFDVIESCIYFGETQEMRT